MFTICDDDSGYIFELGLGKFCSIIRINCLVYLFVKLTFISDIKHFKPKYILNPCVLEKNQDPNIKILQKQFSVRQKGCWNQPKIWSSTAQSHTTFTLFLPLIDSLAKDLFRVRKNLETSNSSELRRCVKTKLNPQVTIPRINKLDLTFPANLFWILIIMDKYSMIHMNTRVTPMQPN